MLRSKSLSFSNGQHSTSLRFPDGIRSGSEYFLLLAAFWALVSSSPTVLGQTGSSSTEDQPRNSQAQICDGLKQDDPHKLALGVHKGEPANADAVDAEQPSGSQSTSELKVKDLSLPQDKLSSSATPEQGLLCKKKKTGPELERALDPSQQPGSAPEGEPAPKASAVSYSDGMLTINAQNIPLRDVIGAIRTRTGISVELPAESMDDPIFDHVGPAPLRDALTQFLYGSKFNYVIQTSFEDPQHVTKLILSSRPDLASAGSKHVSSPVADQAEAPTLYGAAGFTNDSQGEPSPPVPPPNQPTSSATNVVGVPAGFNVQQAAAASGRTTGQVLDELQKRQLQALDDQSPPQ
ncbi:hypothetical protein [Acidicapsa acidisoli]|uniref:hypothetical protein n=1 Tax=Acidicapsa acidisoli TaxID=1615681 RepID=UPI0021E0802C|nr:hypothetical protein [Acidicapsa acidisoli]